MSNVINPGQSSSFSDDCCPPILTSRDVISGKTFFIDIALVIGWVSLFDGLLFQIGTYLAWGIWLISVVFFFAILKWRTANFRAGAWVSLLIVMLGLKLIWGGSSLQIGCGLCLIICNTMAFSGLSPFLPEAFAFLGSMFLGATDRLRSYGIVRPDGSGLGAKQNLSIILPVAVVACFATLFVLANPDIAIGVRRQLQMAFDSLCRLFTGFDIREGAVWLVSGFTLLGILYPARAYLYPERKPVEFELAPELSKMYPAFRNTLLSVIVFFAIYLIFEFSTLWFRKFPENFYYAGYAHQGAFWLTVALALATVVLSAIFRGRVLSDSRLVFLKALAVVWSIENLALSAAVYNRLMIYIGFNGMTQMRVIGLLGITSVVAGFALVVVKLYFDRGFVWLIHRQLWVPAFAILVYAILPVDYLVNRFNVNQIKNGNLAPSVQIVVQRVSAEGILSLVELVECEDLNVQVGARAILALWAEDLMGDNESAYMKSHDGLYRGKWQSKYGHRTPWLLTNAGSSHSNPVQSPWKTFQLSEYLLRNELKRIQPKLAPFMQSPEVRDATIDSFFEYAYQWY